MKHSLPSLDRFKVFESAARHLSFSEAAKELCITKGAVSYQIRQLEQSINTQLFKRSVRQVYLTEQGQKLHQVVKGVFLDLEQGLTQLKPFATYDVVIGATTYVAARWLSPRVAKFLQTHPETSVVFQHNVNLEDFSLDEVDLAIVWGSCSEVSNDEILQVPMPLYPVCSPMLARSIKRDISVLENTTLLSEHRHLDLWHEWFGGESINNPRQTIEDANVRVQAAIDGQGLVLADEMMQDELLSGLLVPLFKRVLNGYGYKLKSVPSRKKNKEAQAMLAWLQSEFEV